jgi:hypothetical protein
VVLECSQRLISPRLSGRMGTAAISLFVLKMINIFSGGAFGKKRAVCFFSWKPRKSFRQGICCSQWRTRLIYLSLKISLCCEDDQGES